MTRHVFGIFLEHATRLLNLPPRIVRPLGRNSNRLTLYSMVERELNVHASSFKSHDDYHRSHVCLSSLILHSLSWLGNSEMTKKHEHMYSTTSFVCGNLLYNFVGSQFRTLTRMSTERQLSSTVQYPSSFPFFHAFHHNSRTLR